jgi:hypothetical protein
MKIERILHRTSKGVHSGAVARVALDMRTTDAGKVTYRATCRLTQDVIVDAKTRKSKPITRSAWCEHESETFARTWCAAALRFPEDVVR